MLNGLRAVKDLACSGNAFRPNVSSDTREILHGPKAVQDDAVSC